MTNLLRLLIYVSKVHNNSAWGVGNLCEDTEDKINTMDIKLDAYIMKAEKIMKKLDQSRRENSIITNLPEGLEGHQPVEFLSHGCHDFSS